MEEIIDIDEMAEKEENEKLKEYLKEDETVSKELSDKIEELTNEKSKLSTKNTEIKEKEDSLRDKLTHDSSTDEIRKIADEIDEMKAEMATISDNIEKLEKELKEITEAKTKTEETKKQYKEKVSSTIDEYEKKISTIEAAIKVCDNEYLKKAQEEELQRMKDTLEGLKEDRSKELKEALGNTMKEENIVESSDTVIPEVEVSTINNQPVFNDDFSLPKEEVSDNKIEEPKMESTNDMPVDLNIDLTLPTDVENSDSLNTESKTEESLNNKEDKNNNDIDINMDLLNSIGLDNVKEEPKIESTTDMPVDLNIDLTLPTDIENTNVSNQDSKKDEPLVNLGEDLPNINESTIDEPKIEDIKPSIDLSDLASFSNVTELNTTKGTKITKTDIVSDDKVSQIFSSRGIIPIVYDYLDNQSKVGA